ncbi:MULTISPECIES: aminoglycoside phosphotransferase family protein [unclassified Streptomyces]|uniref:aminoglycoside phosphotransferase family protein n=1 Tax=unclassified Streptomyces TaxID=2593676 RepID=UPI000DBAAF8B|nr:MULTISPECIES: aminoglycoside phosphotransferase family protein [unclassified Streptomyces]MYT73265.1 kinase [Streptomyces sp. SID8367]RAJ74864.1 streptomycin 6-kinase [Streptomyces sp. PsTaAH-137]
MAFEPPQRLVNALGEVRDDGASAWLADLGALLDEAAARRAVTVERVHVPGGRSSLVAQVRDRDGAPAILKLAPERFRPEAERAALTHWNGFGAVRLLDAGVNDGALLLERLHPEVSVRTLPEAKALLEAAGTLRRLWVDPPAGRNCETVPERTGRQATAMRASVDAFPEVAPLVDAALEARDELMAAPPELRLLHGTFRQSKVLSGERTPWLAVGPDPVVGECAFDLARLVRDRVEDLIGSPSGPAITRRRVKKLAESLDVEQERLRGWTLFRAVESGVRALRVGRERDAENLLEFAGWL